nr:MAG TPA: hypothetical protein [Caudoviricetes sp.]
MTFEFTFLYIRTTSIQSLFFIILFFRTHFEFRSIRVSKQLPKIYSHFYLK